jgi:hypothetical protein
MEYKYRFTKRNFYDKSESQIEGFLDAENFEGAKKKVDAIGLHAEVLLSSSLIVKVEIFDEGKWIVI